MAPTGRIALLLLPLLFAACGPEVYSITQERAYTPSEFRYASAAKELKAVILGNPFENTETPIEQAVLAAMQPDQWGFDVALAPRPRITTDPGDGARSEYRVVVAFNAEDSIEPARLCDGTFVSGPAVRGDEIEARMAFCRDDRLLSMSHGSVSGVTDPRDERFLRMIAMMTRGLFPHRGFRGSSFHDDRSAR